MTGKSETPGDTRRLPWRETFDTVVIWFTTFGYCGDRENEQMLREAAKALKQGRRLLTRARK